MSFQVEMTGSSVFDYVHYQDHSEIAEQLGLCLPSATSMPSPRSDDGVNAQARSVSPPLPDRGK